MTDAQHSDTSGAQRAVTAIGGSQSELARLLGVRPQAVQQWVKSGRVPPRRARAVAELTGIALHELNPDVFPRESAA